MKILPALFTEILIRTHGLIHDPNTAPMLPDLARITLNEHATNVIRQEFRRASGQVRGLLVPGTATETLSTRGRQTREFLLSAKTSGDFFLLFIFWVLLILFTLTRSQWLVVLIVPSGAALPRLWEVILGGRIGVVDGLGPLGGGSLRRGGLVVIGPGASFSSHGG